jgi:shikimate dehydrogenase
MNFLSLITGCFAMPAAENPTVAMIEAAYAHHGLDARYFNCEVAPDALGDAVRGARAMGWAGFNCSIPHKVAVLAHLDGLAASAEVIGAVNCVVRRAGGWIGENATSIGLYPDVDARLGMLVNQGVISVRHWTGVDADPAVMRAALARIFGGDGG